MHFRCISGEKLSEKKFHSLKCTLELLSEIPSVLSPRRSYPYENEKKFVTYPNKLGEIELGLDVRSKFDPVRL